MRFAMESIGRRIFVCALSAMAGLSSTAFAQESPAAAPTATAPAASTATTAPAAQGGALAASSAQVRLDALDPAFASGKAGAFALENASSFTTFSLSNGIPVVLRVNDANHVRSLSIVLRGGTLMTSPADAGIESLMLREMARASREWPYDRLRAKLDETSASFATASVFDYSTYTLVCLDRYFDELLPIWAGTFEEPAWDPADFDRVLSDAKLALQKKDQDPWQATATEMNKDFFAGHPYAATPDGTEESLASMSLAKVKERYAATYSANRFFIVAVGDYDPASLKPALEKAFGSIPDRALAIPTGAPSFEGAVTAGLVKKEFEASKGVAYLRGDFAAPSPTAPDWAAASLAARLYSDLLFNVVRDKYGAAYTPGAVVRSFGSNYGSISVYKTSAPAKIKSYLDEAAGELEAGRAMSVAPKPDEGRSPREAVADVLPVYKAIYINESYGTIRTNAAVAGEIARSVVEFGDPRAWLLDVDRVAAVTADELEKAFKTYFIDAPILWVALGPADMLDKFDPADYKGLGPAH